MNQRYFSLSGISIAVLATLAACGGGGGSDSPTASSASGLALSGYAATGAPLADGTVEFVCSSGTGTATTGADGYYTLTITDGTLPCLGKVTTADTSSTYHTLVSEGTTANITPITDLVVASMAGEDTSDFYDTFSTLPSSEKAAAITAEKVSAAKDAAKTALKNNGVDGLDDTDPVSGTIKPGDGNDAYDKALEKLKEKGDEVKDTIKSDLAAETGDQAPSLPSKLKDLPAASSCAALVSTNYRFIGSQAVDKLTVDAKALTITNSSNDTFYLSPVSGDACHFQVFDTADTAGTSTGDVVLAQSGVAVVRAVQTGTTPTIGIMFPVQKGLTIASAGGKWSYMGIASATGSAPYQAVAGQVTLDKLGSATTLTECTSADWQIDDRRNCATLTGDPAAQSVGVLSLNTDTDGYTTSSGSARYAYTAGTGDVMFVSRSTNGSLYVGTRQRTLAAPVVGDTKTSWTLYENSSLEAGPVSANTITITSVDAPTSATTTFVRTSETVGSSPSDKHSETLTNNTPAKGYRYRAPGSYTVDGAQKTYSELVQLPLKGIGITVAANETNKRFQLSVTTPSK